MGGAGSGSTGRISIYGKVKFPDLETRPVMRGGGEVVRAQNQSTGQIERETPLILCKDSPRTAAVC